MPITVNALHPGPVSSSITRHFIGACSFLYALVSDYRRHLSTFAGLLHHGRMLLSDRVADMAHRQAPAPRRVRAMITVDPPTAFSFYLVPDPRTSQTSPYYPLNNSLGHLEPALHGLHEGPWQVRAPGGGHACLPGDGARGQRHHRQVLGGLPAGAVLGTSLIWGPPWDELVESHHHGS